jgi:hypothetical protein
MRAFIGLCLFLASAANVYFWEFIRAVLYEKGLYAMSEHGVLAIVADYGITTALALTGLLFFWPSRPEILRWRPIRIFLERDSVSDLMGIQTFPAVKYIQASVTASAAIEKCRAWITRSEFSPDGTMPFALEHNERVPLQWSKHGGQNPLEANLNPGDPPVRCNVLIFDANALQVDTETPTNCLSLLQRHGFHRITVKISGKGRFSINSETRQLIINWQGWNGDTYVSLNG